jgi:hypothetical protein
MCVEKLTERDNVDRARSPRPFTRFRSAVAGCNPDRVPFRPVHSTGKDAMNTTRSTTTAVLAAAAVALVAGCAGQQPAGSGGGPKLGIATSPPGTSSPGTAVHGIAPGPPAHLASTCPAVLSANYAYPSSSRVSMVAGTPNNVAVCRYEGLNDPHPHRLARAVDAGLEQAAYLAKNLDLGKPMSGTVNCPNDDGTAALLVFGFADGHRSAVTVSLTGCRTATNGKRTVVYPKGVSAEVRALAGTS